MAKMRRFVCALLAVMLLVSSFAVHAETDKGSIPMGSLDINTYSSLLEQAMNLYNKQIMEKYYQEVIAKKTASERSELLMSWYEAGEMSLYRKIFFADFFTYCKENHGTEGLICTCETIKPFKAEGHDENCPWNTNNFVATTIEGMLDGASISVSGDIPETAELSLRTVTLDEVRALVPDVTVDGETYNPVDGFKGNRKIIMDLSVMDEGKEWQPAEGETVSVTLDVSSIGRNGDDMMVYHVHENEDGSVETELVGPFKTRNGEISFDMSRFSFVLVLNSTYSINNVDVFYKANGAEKGYPVSTNGNLYIIGAYYESASGDASGDAHVLVGIHTNNFNNAEGKIEYIIINGENFYKDKLQYYGGNSTQITDGNTVLASFPQMVGFLDVNVGSYPLTSLFKLGAHSGSGGWNIDQLEVPLILDYEIIKKVATGTSATGASFGDSVTVERGDWVIFQIDVNNKGERSLDNMLVQDLLPAGVFDTSTVQMSIDGRDGEIGNWQPFNQVLFNNYTSAGGTSRKLYIKAQVDPNLSITADTPYVNKATIDGMNMPTASDTASVTVKKPSDLRVSKAVTSENPNDPAPDDVFTFTIQHSNQEKGPFDYKKSDNTDGKIENGGTFTLKNGESIEFIAFPDGGFTVIEEGASGYTTKVNGTASNVYRGTMSQDNPPAVAFENQFNMRVATLTITKQLQDGETPTAGHQFTFVVIIDDGQDEHGTYSYSVNGVDATDTISGDGKTTTTILIEAGQSAVINDLPINATYSVEETDIPAAYKFVSADGSDDDQKAIGTIVQGGNTALFVNKYNVADLTIKKEGLGKYEYKDGTDNESAIVTVTGDGKTWTLALSKGNGMSVTLKGLTVGATYTITEQDGWTWRYSATGSTTYTMKPTENIVTIKNEPENPLWLGGDNYAINTFKAPNAQASN